MADDFIDFMTSGGDELINSRKDSKTGKWIPPEKADRIHRQRLSRNPVSKYSGVVIAVWGIIIVAVCWVLIKRLSN